MIIEGPETAPIQLPSLRVFHASEKWPDPLRRLYEEAAKSFSAGAYKAATMVCRKLLMSAACEEGADEGGKFVDYVKHITENVLNFPRAKASIDAIRTIVNDANHVVEFVDQDEARRAMEIVTYMLDTLYAFPKA